MSILTAWRDRTARKIREDARNLDPHRFRLKWGFLSWGMSMGVVFGTVQWVTGELHSLLEFVPMLLFWCVAGYMVGPVFHRAQFSPYNPEGGEAPEALRFAYRARTPLPILIAAVSAIAVAVPWILAVQYFDLREGSMIRSVILPSLLIISAAIALLGGYRLGIRLETRFQITMEQFVPAGLVIFTLVMIVLTFGPMVRLLGDAGIPVPGLWAILLVLAFLFLAFRLGKYESRRGSERPSDWEEYRGIR